MTPTEEASAVAVRNQPDGGANAEGRHTVLRLRARAAESALSKHTVLKGIDRRQQVHV